MRSVGSEVDLTKIAVNETNEVVKDKLVGNDKIDSFEGKSGNVIEEEEDCDEVTVDTDYEDSDDESDDEMEDEDEDEIARIVEDAAKLKALAQAFLHPEKPVVSDPTAFGRNFYNRASAPETESREEAEERASILKDAEEMKKAVAGYAHPEVGVKTTDGSCFGRNYFSRTSAPETEDSESALERKLVFDDLEKLKKAAKDYLHPEIGVETTDGTAFGRNFFNRPSAPDTEDDELADEREEILAEMKSLKKLAVDYMHPEIGVKTTDGAAFGRNYFTRPSAPESEDDEMAEERARVLVEAKALKKLAVDYMHPEIGVGKSDGAKHGRNYFTRPSATESEDNEMAEERAKVLAEAKALKKLAVDYVHPEIGVKTADGAAFGRNYFNRPSATETEDDELADDREEILAEMRSLKKLAVDYMHPEIGAKTTDGAAYGRNYFNRPSAPESEDTEMAEERARVLAEAEALKKIAVDYMHPETGVKSCDGALYGRNYFDRPSATEIEDVETSSERDAILAEMKSLKKLVVDYMHPEINVKTTDGTAFGRNYFNRPSAPETEDDELADEREEILAEVRSLKKLAVDYMHPEIGVKTTDGTVYGRNYFTRPSAVETESNETAEERANILAEAEALKKLAVDFMYPEIGVKVSDGTVFGRNYFDRPSATEVEECEIANERARILAEAKSLKKQAVDYAHPEIGVESSDGASFGRNYFNRPSAPETEDVETAKARAEILAEKSSLKKLAVDYMHPEVGVKTSDGAAYGRNYFGPEDNAVYTESTAPAMPEGVTPIDTNLKEVESHDSFNMFDMDDGNFAEMRATFSSFVPIQSKVSEVPLKTDEEEGNLSRSPSSVMLFGLEQGNDTVN
jgi:xylose isomerase